MQESSTSDDQFAEDWQARVDSFGYKKNPSLHVYDISFSNNTPFSNVIFSVITFIPFSRTDPAPQSEFNFYSIW